MSVFRLCPQSRGRRAGLRPRCFSRQVVFALILYYLFCAGIYDLYLTPLSPFFFRNSVFLWDFYMHQLVCTYICLMFQVYLTKKSMYSLHKLFNTVSSNYLCTSRCTVRCDIVNFKNIIICHFFLDW